MGDYALVLLMDKSMHHGNSSKNKGMYHSCVYVYRAENYLLLNNANSGLRVTIVFL